MKLPTRRNILEANRLLIARTKGLFVPPDNLLHPDGLDWALEAIKCPVFGVDRFPTLAEKATQLAWTIIKGHVFYDGNKRTAMAVLRTMIVWNGYEMDVTAAEIETVALRAAAGEWRFDEFLQWVREKMAPSASHLR